jgi:hypothetical protein
MERSESGRMKRGEKTKKGTERDRGKMMPVITRESERLYVRMCKCDRKR